MADDGCRVFAAPRCRKLHGQPKRRPIAFGMSTAACQRDVPVGMSMKPPTRSGSDVQDWKRWEGVGWAFRTLTFSSLSANPCSILLLSFSSPSSAPNPADHAVPGNKGFATCSDFAQLATVHIFGAFSSSGKFHLTSLCFRQLEERQTPPAPRLSTQLHDMAESGSKNNFRYTGTPWYTMVHHGTPRKSACI